MPPINGKYVPVKQNPKFSPGELVKIRLDRCGANNRTYYYAATETERHKIKLEAEDVGIYLEEFAYHNQFNFVRQDIVQIGNEKFGGLISMAPDADLFAHHIYPEGTILHKVLFGEHGIVFVGRHFLKKVK